MQKVQIRIMWYWIIYNYVQELHLCSSCSISFMPLQVALSVELENCTALILGLGLFFQWCGLLHFFSYFDKFNVRIFRVECRARTVGEEGVGEKMRLHEEEY